MQEFFAQIDTIKGNISFIQASTTQIGGMKEKVCAHHKQLRKDALQIILFFFLSGRWLFLMVNYYD